MAGFPKIYKRYQGPYTRSITVAVLTVVLAATCYFVFTMLDSYVQTDEPKSVAVKNVVDKPTEWVFSKPWPTEEAPVYPANTPATAEAMEAMDKAGVAKWMFRRADAVPYALYIQYGIPFVVFAVGCGFIFYLANWERFADFLIQTEGEMKKVSWSSKAELIGSTTVVIVTVAILAVLIYVADFVWIKGLKFITVLPGK